MEPILVTEEVEKGHALHVPGPTEQMWTLVHDALPLSTYLRPFAKQSWRNKEESNPYSASLPLFWLLNASTL